MQELTEIPAVPVESDAERAELSAKLLAQAQKAVNDYSLADCNHIAEWAFNNPHPAAGPALCALLRRPNAFKARRVWKGDAWVDMRIGAIRALAVNRDQLAAPTLAYVLVHDVPAVRAEARIALQALGPAAVVSIVETVRVANNWPTEGMLTAIETLGLIGDKNAGPTLARILFGLLPNTSTRWLKLQLKWAALLGALETLCVFGIIFSDNDGAIPLIMVPISAAFMFAAFSSLSALGVGVIIRKGKSNESNRINSAAADALICIKDPRSVPSLVEVATEKYSQSARSGAMQALRETLPVLNTSDYGLLTAAVERRLTGMFAMNNAQLTLASVRSLEFVGTGQSVGPVDRLARRKNVSSATVYAEIKSEAARVLPVLQERKRLEEASSVLLRPSQVAPDSAGVLLRAASSLSAYEEPVEQLLRPGSRE